MSFLSSIFGIGTKAAGTGIKEVLEGVGSLAKDIRQAITGDLPPEKKAEILQRLNEIEAQLSQAQIQVNQQEASSTSLFVAGWRPFVGWVCGFALCWNYIVHPLFCWITVLASLHVQPPPVLGLGEMMPILMGMLGLGALRTKEKMEGVHSYH